MTWFRRERRKAPRPGKSEPTYVVERDAPDWHPPDPFDRRWSRRAHALAERLRFDAYPDHQEPFEDMEVRHLPVPEQTVPKFRHGEVYLMVVGRKNAKVVPLGSLDRINLGKRIVQAWVLGSINDTAEEVMALDEESDKGQSMVEYALIIALIAVVAIVGLIFLGNQISGILNTVGTEIGG